MKTPTLPVEIQSIEKSIMQGLIHQMSEAIFAKDLQGRVVYHNPAAAEILAGDALADLRGMTVYDFYTPEIAAELQAEEQRIIATGQPVFDREVASTDERGELRWFMATQLPWRDDNGNIIGLVGIHRDITERKLADLMISRRNREIELLYEAGRQISRSLNLDDVYDTFYNMVLEIMPCDSMIVSSFDARDQMIRAKYGRIHTTRLDIAGFPPIPLEPEGYGTQSVAIRSGKSMMIQDYQERLRKTNTTYSINEKGICDPEAARDDPDQPRSVLIVPMLLEGGVIGVVQVFSNQINAYSVDQLRILEALASQVAAAHTNALIYLEAQKEIADRKLAEQSLRALAEENARLAEARSNLLQEVNHRVKNNLTSILGLLEMEINRPAEERSDVPVLLRTIQERILGMAYVHNLLSSVQWTPLKMESLLSHIITAVLNNASIRPKIHLTIQVDPEDMQIIPRQATSLALILNELTMNSIKHAFVNRESGMIKVDARMDKTEPTPRVILVYQDDGPGLPADVLNGGHHGVGMEVIRLSVQSPLNGEIHYDNENGARAVLQFRLAQGSNNQGNSL